MEIELANIPDENLNETLESLRKNKDATLRIKVDDVKRILEQNLTFKGIKVNYICYTASEAQEEIIDRFDNANITVGRVDNVDVEPVSLGQYKIMLSKLRELVQGISLEESEKKRFKKVYINVGKKLIYDEKMMSNDKKFEQYQKINKSNSRNLVNALLHGKCVCAGMAETLKQALSLVNIKCINCTSNEIEQGEDAGDTHVFNMVKIDGIWYNTDITWDEHDIKNGEYPYYCLKSDKEFENVKNEHDKECHKKDKMDVPECTQSLELFKFQKIKRNIKRNFNYLRKRISNIKERFTPVKKIEQAKSDFNGQNDLKDKETALTSLETRKEFIKKLEPKTAHQETVNQAKTTQGTQKIEKNNEIKTQGEKQEGEQEL